MCLPHVKRLEPGTGSPFKALYTSGASFVYLAAALSLSLPLIVIAHIEGNLFNESIFSLSKDLGFAAQYILLLPASILATGAIGANIPRALNNWKYRGDFLASDVEYHKIMNQTNIAYSRRSIVFIAVTLAAGAVLYGAVIHTFSKLETWHSNSTAPYGTVAGLFVLSIRFFLYFILIDFAIRVVITLRAYVDLLRFGLRVQLFHADCCGGISHIGSFWVSNYIYILLIGFTFWLLVFFVQRDFWNATLPYFVILVIYGVAAVIGIIPLVATHYAMLDAKHKLLHKVDTKAQSIAENALKDIDQNNVLDASNLVEVLKIREIFDKIPVWPYDFRKFSFITISLVPALVALASLYEKVMKILE